MSGPTGAPEIPLTSGATGEQESIFDVLREYPGLAAGSFVIGGGLGFWAGKYISSGIGIPLAVAGLSGLGLTAIVLNEQTSPESFFQQIQESPIVSGISFTAGALVGGIGAAYLESLIHRESIVFPLIVALVVGTGTMYIVLKIWNYGEVLERKAEDVKKWTIELLGGSRINAMGEVIENIIDWLGINEVEEFKVRDILIWRARMEIGSTDEGVPIPKTLTLNQEIILNIIKGLPIADIQALLSSELITVNRYRLSLGDLQSLADFGATIAGGQTVTIDKVTTVAILNISQGGTVESVADNKLVSGLHTGFLRQNGKIYSPHAYCYVIMQGDGNLVEYRGSTPIWSSHTSEEGDAPYILYMQEDGNLVVYDRDGDSIWSSQTSERGVKPYTFKIEDDGNLQIVDGVGSIIWDNHVHQTS